jgi:carboxyl-terminal processing protease
MPGVRFIGTPTYGFTSANQDHRLADGSVLRLTVAHFADRAGLLYTGPITPDEPADDPLPAALRWAAGQG